jgi:hypothetical protein
MNSENRVSIKLLNGESVDRVVNNREQHEDKTETGTITVKGTKVNVVRNRNAKQWKQVVSQSFETV